MRPARLLLVSTPIGHLGSGLGGGVELTVPNVARALRDRGHRVTIVAPAGSVVPGFEVLEAAGRPPPSAQHLPRDAPVELPADSLVANLFELARRHQGDYDAVVNFAYDWLGYYLTPFFTTPLGHVLSMGSLTDALDEAAARSSPAIPGRVAAHTRAQAATYSFGDHLVLVGNGLDLEQLPLQPPARRRPRLGGPHRPREGPRGRGGGRRRRRRPAPRVGRGRGRRLLGGAAGPSSAPRSCTGASCPRTGCRPSSAAAGRC